MKHIKYYMTILLSVIDIGLIGLCIIDFLKRLTGDKSLLFIPILIIGILALLLRPLRLLRIRYRRDVEYDEYGLNKKKKYEYLSKAERDQIDLNNMAIMESLVSTTVIKKMTKNGSKRPLEDLDKLIGLDNVKKEVKKIEARLMFEKQRKGMSNGQFTSGRHLVLIGNPGTGKTTIARILTGIFYKYKVIPKNKCLEVDGNFLNAGTASGQKTELIIRAAKGGVLFIDEAYALISNPEAIATLIKRMEDDREDFILIMAGYTEPMNELIQSNPGFESRIRDFIPFSDYNSIELRQIAALMTNENGLIMDEHTIDIFDSIMDKERRSPEFGNARTVRSVIDKAVDQHAYRLMMKELDKSDTFRLTYEDFKY